MLPHANMMAVMVGVMALLSQHVNCAAAAPTLGPGADHVTVRSEQHIRIRISICIFALFSAVLPPRPKSLAPRDCEP